MADIENSNNNIVLNGSGDSDIITNTGTGVTINAGEGDDYVTNEGKNAVIDLGKGTDWLQNSGTGSSINTGEGKYEITNSANNVSVNTSDRGYGQFTNTGNYVTLNGGSGRNQVLNEGSNVFINNGTWSNSVDNKGEHVTINGSGNISNTGRYALINNGTSIENSGSYTTIRSDSSGEKISNSAANVFIEGGNSNLITNTGNNVTVKGFTVVDSPNAITAYGIRNYGNNVSIGASGLGYYRIDNYGSTVTINGDDNRAGIYSYAGQNVLIRSGKGDDWLVIKDFEGNSSSKNTIQGGAGDDTVSLTGSNHVIQYARGDGKDMIYGYNSSDKIQITDGAKYATQVSGSNVIVSFRNGYISIANAASLGSINITGGKYDPDAFVINTISNAASNSDTIIYGGDGNDSIYNAASNVKIYAGKGYNTVESSGSSIVAIHTDDDDDIILNSNSSSKYITINAGAGNDSIANFASYNTIIAGIGNDTINYGIFRSYTTNNLFDAGEGDDIIEGSSYSTISGGAGNDSINVRYGNYTSIGGGPGNDTIYNHGGDNGSSNMTIRGGSGDDSIYSQHISNMTIDGEDGNDTIIGYLITQSTIDAGDNDDFVSVRRLYEPMSEQVSVNGGAGNDTVEIYESSYITVQGGDGNDLIINDNGSDVTVNGGDGNDTVNRADLYQYVGGNDVITNFASGNKIQLVNGSIDTYSIDGDDVILKIGTGSLRINGVRGQAVIINGSPKKFDNESENQGGGSEESSSGGSDDPTPSEVTPSSNERIPDIENNESNKKINGSARDEWIRNYGGASRVTIDVGAGNDSVSNTDGSLISINGGDGDDSIKNSNGTRITIRGGAGNDFVSYDAANLQSFHYIDGGADNDTVESFGEHATVVGGDGDDKISHGGIYSSLVGGAGNDTVENWEGGYSTIDGGEGDDYLRATAHSSVKGGDGNDSIFNDSDHNTLDGGAGHDSINNYGRTASNTYINTGDGNDSVRNDGADNVTINVGEGDDSILNWGGWHMTIDAGEGNDTIDNYALDRVNENTGETVYASDYYLNGGDGDDSIRGGAKNITILGGEGNDTVDAWGSSNATINVGVGDDYVEGKMEKATVVGGEGNDTLKISGSKNIIDGGKGDNHIHSWSANGSIKTEDGDDYIYNLGDAANSTINSGDGSDSIINEGANVLLNAGAGDDYVEGEMQNSTVYGGKGNDTIESNTDSYDGDTPKAHDNYLDGGDDDDFIKTWHGSNFTMLGGKGNDTIRSEGEADTNYGKNNYIDAGEGDDSIVNAFAADNATLLGGAGNDFIAAEASDNNIVNGGSGNDYLRHTGWWDFDNHSIKGTQNTSLDGGDGSDTILNECGSNATIIGGKGNDSIYCTAAWMDGDPMTAPNNNIVDGGDDDDTINNYGGSNVTIKGGDGNDIIENENARVHGYGNIVFTADKVSIDGGAGADTIRNNAENVTMNGGAGNDFIYNDSDNVTIEGGAGNDSVRLWGINNIVRGGTGNDSVEAYTRYIFTYANGDGNDVISKGAIINLINGATIGDTITSENNTVLKIGNGFITVQNAAPEDIIVVRDNNYSKYLADIIYNNEPEQVVGNPNSTRNQKITNYGENSTIKGGAGDDSIYNYGENSNINGGAGNDFIYNYSDNVTIEGGAGNDSIRLWGINNIVRGGAGNDYVEVYRRRYIFTYAEGDGDDVISKGAIINLINGATIDETITSGKDTVLKIGNGFITVQNDVPENIIVVRDNNYSKYLFDIVKNDEPEQIVGNASSTRSQMITNDGENCTINGGAGDDYLENYGSNSTVNAGAGKDSIYNYDYNTYINGGADDDVIVDNSGAGDEEFDEFIEGEGANNTIDGGAGNDIIEFQGSDYIVRGGAGNDSVKLNLLYDDGEPESPINLNEYIFEYAPGDGNDVVSKGAIIGLIDGLTPDEISADGDDAVVKIGNGSITVKDTKPEEIIIVTDGIYDEYFGYDVIINETADQLVRIENPTHKKAKITNIADDAIIYGGAGNDIIRNEGRNVSIVDTSGDNLIYTYFTGGTLITGDGNDAVIAVSNDNDRNYINVGGGRNYVNNNGSNTTIISGSKRDTIYCCSNAINNSIITGAGDDSIEFNGANSTVDAGAGKDTIISNGANSKVNADADDDYIRVNGSNSNVDAGAGDDSVEIYASDSKVNTGAGADTILNFNSNTEIICGEADNDYIYNGVSREAYEKADQKIDEKSPGIKNALTSFSTELSAHYEEAAEELKNEIDSAVSKIGGVLSDDPVAILKKVLEGSLNITGGLITIKNGFETLMTLTTLDETFYNIFKSKKFYQDTLHYNEWVNKLLDDIQLTPLERQIEKAKLDDVKKPREEQYIKTFSKNDKLTQIRQNKQMSYWEKINKAHKILEQESKVISESPKILAPVNKTGVLNKFCQKFDWIVLAYNVFDSRKEIADSWNADEKASFIERWANFGNNFKQLDHKKYDKINTTLIDIAVGGISGLVLGAIGVAGAPVWLAATAGMAFTILGAAVVKTAYYSYQHKGDVDVWKTFLRNVNPFGGEYESKTSTAYALPVTDNITTLDGGDGNDIMMNDEIMFVVILGGAGDDLITNQNSDNVTIIGGDGNDTITNINSSNVTIKGDEGDDLITNYSNTVIIIAGNGNNTIMNYDSSDVSITAGDGDDYIDNNGNGNTIDAGNGNNVVANVGADVWMMTSKGADTINSLGIHVNIATDAGDDNIINEGGNSTINAGEGNDSVDNQNSNNVLINVGAGDDYVESSGDSNTINASDGDDVVNNVGINNAIDVGNGDDYVENYGHSNTVISGAGEDYIINVGNNNLIDLGADHDYLVNFGDANTLIGSKGNDIIDLQEGGNNVINYFNGDGSDFIYGLTSTDTLNIADDVSYLTVRSGDDLLIKMDEDTITLKDIADVDINIVGGDSKNTRSNTVIAFTDNDDYIINNVDNVTIDAGAGNDTVDNFANRVVIIGNTDNDLISLKGSNEVVEYTEGDGNDTVYGYSSDTTIRVDGEFSTVESGNDVIINVGDGSILLKDAVNETLNVFDKYYSSNADTLSPGIEYNPKKPTKLIVKDPFLGNVNASNISDNIMMIDASNSTKPVILKAASKGTVINAGSGESTLIGSPKDDKYYGGEGVNVFVYTVGEGKDVVFDYEAQDIISIAGATRDQMTFTDKKDAVTITFSNNNKASLTINKVVTTDALTIDIGGETFKYGELPPGVTFDSNDKKTGLKVGSTAADGVTVNAVDIVSTAKTLDGSAAGGSVYLIGNSTKNVIQAGKNGSTLYGGNYNAADKLYGGDGADVFIYSTGDGADVIYDFDGTKDKVMLKGVTALDASNVNVSANKIIVTINGQKLTLDNPNGEVRFVNDSDTELYTVGINFPAGVGYNAKKTAVTVGAAASNVGTIDLSGNAYVSTVKEVDAKAYNDTLEIIGNANANVLYASKGGSTLDGGAGADKYYGGDDADVFVYDGQGADVIYDFDGTKDKVMLKGVTALDPKDVNVSANKIVVTINGQKLTLDNPNGEVRFVNDSDTELYTVGINFPNGMGYNAKKTAVTVGAEAADVGTIDLSSSKYLPTVKEVDAKAYNGALEIIGNASANVIYAGKGGSTLDGGAGADKYYGGDDADVFVYDGQGADVIYDFDGSKDKVMLKGLTALDPKDINVSANKIVVTINGQKLTFDNPNGEVRFVDDSDTELYTVGINFPNGMGYNAKKTAVTVSADASNVGTIDLSTSKYLPTVKEVDAKAYNDTLEIIGNGQANILYAGKGAATLNGGYDTNKNKATADKLYGSTVGADVFVWDASMGGGDQIYNYSAAAGDIISVTGNATIDSKTSFKESGNKVVLTVDKQKLTINDVKDQPVVVVNGNNTVTFGSLPGGVTYADNKKSLKIANPFTGTVQADDYASTVVTLDGSAATDALTLIGNKKAKVLKGGVGQTTMIGSAAADNFYAGTGSDVIFYADGDGKDIVYDFDGTKDVIKLSGATVSVTDFVEKKNDIVLTVGKGSITLKDAPRGTITVEQSGGTVTYKTLPTNVTYKATKEAVTLGKEFSGTLNAADLGLPVKEMSAAAATGKVHLIGMSTATKLTASKGGSTLVGGAGADTLIGGAGADIFVTSGGNDFINKYTAGQDKLQIVGTLKSGKLDGSNVELTTSNGTVTIKGVVNKELTLTVNGADQKYKFTKTNTTLDTALITGNAQQPADYWFLPSDDTNDELGSLINESTTADDAALGSLTMSFEQSTSLELTANVIEKRARHIKK